MVSAAESITGPTPLSQDQDSSQHKHQASPVTSIKTTRKIGTREQAPKQEVSLCVPDYARLSAGGNVAAESGAAHPGAAPGLLRPGALAHDGQVLGAAQSPGLRPGQRCVRGGLRQQDGHHTLR